MSKSVLKGLKVENRSNSKSKMNGIINCNNLLTQA